MGYIEAWLPCGPGDVEEEIRCGVAGLVGDSSTWSTPRCSHAEENPASESQRGECRFHTWQRPFGDHMTIEVRNALHLA
jgi:hypothetical protein